MKILIIILTFLLTSTIWSQERFEIPCKKYLFDLRMDSLKTQIGIKEKTGNNDGEVLKYQKPFGLKNKAYCKMLQDWAFLINLRTYKDAPYPFNPLVISIYQYAGKQGLKTVYEGFVGDLIVWRNKGKITGHIECIVLVKKKGWVETIAGNTSNGLTGSQREGNGVYRRERNIKHPLSRILQIKGLVGFKVINELKRECDLK